MWSPASAMLSRASGLGGLARGDEQGADAALERGDALLDDVGGRVHDARVDVAELLEPEQVRGVVGVVEDVARRLVDRQRRGLRWPCRGSVRRGSAWSRRTSWGSRSSVVLLVPCRWPVHDDGCVPGAPTGRCGREALRACRATRCPWPGPHPGHPTAVGGLPASEPGLVAGTHDLLGECTYASATGEESPSSSWTRARVRHAVARGVDHEDVLLIRTRE